LATVIVGILAIANVPEVIFEAAWLWELSLTLTFPLASTVMSVPDFTKPKVDEVATPYVVLVSL
jgi:hypothetical protein